MILLLKLVIITSILVLGYTIITQENMALHKLRVWANKEKNKGAKWVEPVLLCHWCQPSTWAIFSFAIAFGLGIINHFELKLILYYILTVAGSSLVNGLIWGYHVKTDAQTEFYRSGENACDAITESIYAPREDEELEENYFNHQHN